MIRLLLAFSCLLSSCLVVEPTFDKLPPGTYRGVFYLDGRQSERRAPDSVAANFKLESVPQSELPVNLEVSYGADSSLQITFRNGSERIQASKVEFVRLLTTAQDSVTIHFPLNDSYITAYHEDGVIEGSFVDLSRGDYRIPFAAFYGIGYRFTDLRKPPAIDLSGRWEAKFGVENSANTEAAIGEFSQEGNALSGTFLTETGDYRYLEGTVQKDRFYLSAFDGGHVFLFAGKILPDSTLLGLFRSGNHYQTIFTAKKNGRAQLPDARSQTKVLNPEKAVQLNVLDPQTGATIQLLDRAEFKDKIKVLTLMGSWCPNCRDEAVFLDSLRQNLPQAEIAFAGLAYERFRDTSKAVAAINRFRKNLNIDFPIYLAGYADKAQVSAQLPFLDRVRSFPTLLILDSQNRVIYTHTGFSGPATSEYGAFTREFAQTLQNFLTQ